MKENFKYEHYLITRFNVNAGYEKGGARLNIDYLSSRLELFEKYCYPSVKNQTRDSFKWLILFDYATPEAIKVRLKKFQTTERFLFLYLENRRDWLEELKARVSKNLSSGTTHLVTSNLDSDDFLGAEYIEKIQSNILKSDMSFLNFRYGYVLYAKTNEIHLREHVLNPFFTLIEDALAAKTVHSYVHSEICDYPIQQIICRPMWFQVFHDSNVANQKDVNSVWQSKNRLSEEYIKILRVKKDPMIISLMSLYRQCNKMAREKRPLFRKLSRFLQVLFPELQIFLQRIRLKLGLLGRT